MRSFLNQRLFHDGRRLQEAVEHLVHFHGGRHELSRLLETGRALMRGYTGTLLERTSRELDCPTLIVWGTEDGLVPVTHARAFASAVPHAQLEVLEDCGHYPQIELPSRFNALLEEFLAGGAARRPRARRPAVPASVAQAGEREKLPPSA